MKRNIYDSDVLCRYKAAKALDKYIKKLEKRKIEGLTEKQRNALIKAVQVFCPVLVQPNNHYAKNSRSISQNKGEC